MPRPPVAFPAFLDLRKRLVVVIGSGAAAERRAHTFLKYGADIVVIGTDPTMPLIEAEADGLLTLERRPFEPGDLTGAFIVVCLDSDDGIQQAVLTEARERACLLSLPHAPGLSNFSTPSTIRRGDLQIAISTSGQAPEIARHVKAVLAEEYGDEWAPYVALIAELRASLADSAAEERRSIIEAVISSDVLDRVRDGHAPEVASLIEEFRPDGADNEEPHAAESAEGTVEADAPEAPDRAGD